MSDNLFNQFAKENKDQILYKTSFEQVFKTEDGMRILSVLYSICIPLIGNFEQDSRRAAFNDGQLSLFMFILKMANIPMTEFFAPVFEQYKKIQRNNLDDLLTKNV